MVVEWAYAICVLGNMKTREKRRNGKSRKYGESFKRKQRKALIALQQPHCCTWLPNPYF
jgi:hypothetical protein